MVAALKEAEKKVESLRGIVHTLERENDLLREQIRVMQQLQSRTAPKQEDERQLHLEIKVDQSVTVEAEQSARDEDEAGLKQLPSSTTKRGKKLRMRGAEKFENIPVEKETVIIPEEVQNNPQDWECIGEEVTYEVVVHPTRLSRHKITRRKYRNQSNRAVAPIIAKAPIRFSTNYTSISLAVYITLNKYLEHGALYRLEQKFARLGADITRQSQSDTVERLSQWVRPLYELIDKQTRESHYLQIDETFIKYINGQGSGIGQGYFWAIHAPDKAMVYTWIADRKHQNVDRLLAGFSGLLQSDGYAAYEKYALKTPEVVLAACWAHVFRSFRNAMKHEPELARQAMHLIGKLYKLEEQWDEQQISNSDRQQRRANESMPIAQTLKEALDSWSVDFSIPKNDFRVAVGYAINQWNALLECLKHGHTRLDTNLLESKFRPTKIGAKNWMFIGHPNAGEKSAIVYTLLSSCRIHRIEPRAYLTDVLEQLIPHDRQAPADLLESLLPWNWASTHPEHIIKEQPMVYAKKPSPARG
jgi:transposase